MPAITVKNIPEELYIKLKKEAACNFRSLNNEVIYRLEQSTSVQPIDVEDRLKAAKALRESVTISPEFTTPEFIKQAINEGRP